MNQQKSKPVFFAVAVGFLFFAGVAAILYPLVGNIYSLSTSRTVISDYVETVTQMPEKEKDDHIEKAIRYNIDIAGGKFDDGLERCLCDENGLICYVDIPSVNIYLPCYYGATNDNLQKGTALLERTSLPVGGVSCHTVISGHTGLPNAEMFTKLDQIKEGEMFYLHTLDKVFAYRVDLISIVIPSDVELLRVTQGKDRCTLLTCTPYGINDKRLLVRGTRIFYEEPEETPVEAAAPDDSTADDPLRDEINSQLAVIIVIAVAAVLLYVLALMWLFGLFGDILNRGRRYRK